MSYCLHPNCQNPHNSNRLSFCRSCGRPLRLGNRYRATKLIQNTSNCRIFLAVDEGNSPQKKCIIQQFIFPEIAHPTLGYSTHLHPKFIAQFHQKTVQMKRLGKHPQIPQLLDAFPQEPLPCWVREFIEGKTLAQELAQNGSFSESKIRGLLRELLPVLEFLHRHRIIHHDINPENIVRRTSDQQLVFINFGISNITASLNQTPGLKCLLFSEYTAPELSKNLATFTSDIYSLGLVCIHLLTGISPSQFYISSENVMIWKNFLVDHTIRSDLEKLLEKMIQRNLEERYQTVSQVLEDFWSLPNILYYQLDNLYVDKKRFIVKQVLASAIPGSNLLFRSDVDSMSSQEITNAVYETFRKFANLELEKERISEEDIFAVWLQEMIRIVKQMSVPKEYNLRKKLIIAQLDSLKDLPEDAQKRENLETIVKDILSLLFEAMNPKDKSKFVAKVIEEAKRQLPQFIAEIETVTLEKLILEEITDLPSVVTSCLSSIIIERLSQGFLVHILSEVGLQPVRSFISVLAGPLDWGLVILETLGSGVSAVSKYRQSRKKVLFIQTIFSVYSYSLKLV